MAKRKTPQAGVGATAPDEPALNPAQKKFARLYARHGNATGCYLKAYPDSTYDSAMTDASRLLRNAPIQDFIKRIQERDRIAADFPRQEALMLLAAKARKKDLYAIESLWSKLGYNKASDSGSGEADDISVLEETRRILAGGAA